MKKLWLVFGFLLSLLVLYEVARTLSARKKTVKIFSQILSADNINLQASSLTETQINDLIKVQDPKFFNHHGLDRKTNGAGATTLTQALVKKLYFKNFKKGFAKIEQSLIARFAVDPKISKEDQITVFLNIAYFGQCHGAPVKGFSNAAHCYYGKNFNALSQIEYHGLLAMLIAPNTYNPNTSPQKHAKRLRRIEAYLAEQCAPQNHKDLYYKNCDQ